MVLHLQSQSSASEREREREGEERGGRGTVVYGCVGAFLLSSLTWLRGEKEDGVSYEEQVGVRRIKSWGTGGQHELGAHLSG